MRIAEPESSCSEIRHEAIESAKTGVIDAIKTDDANKCYILPCSRFVDPVVRFLGQIDREARRGGVVIPGEAFHAAHLAYIHHLVPPVHSIDFAGLPEFPMDVQFGIPLGSAWSIGKKWFGRAWRHECSSWEAFKNFLIELFTKYGIAFIVKKTGVIVAQWAWGVSGALMLGPLLFFAGLLLGTKLGNKATRLAFEFAQARLVEHERLMRVELDASIQKGLREMSELTTKHTSALIEVLETQRKDAMRALETLRDAEADCLKQASEAIVEALKMLIRALQRDERRRVPWYNFPILERFQNSDKAEFLRGWSARRQALVQEGIACLYDPNLFRRFERFQLRLAHFTVDYKPLRRAMGRLQSQWNRSNFADWRFAKTSRPSEGGNSSKSAPGGSKKNWTRFLRA